MSKSRKVEGHPIQVVARRTGLSQDVIRVWERRYGAVTPRRSASGRRLYSDPDVERLTLLRRVTRAGRRIGDVAGLTREALLELVAGDAAAVTAPAAGPGADEQPVARSHLDACLAAVRELDPVRVEAELSRAAVMLATPALMDTLLRPLLREIGDRWLSGELRVAHEHLTSAVVRSFLGTIRNGHMGDGSEPDVVVTTPAGQLHEFGALMAAVTAGLDGWSVTYLGPNLPAEDVAAVARQRGSRAVTLSIVHPADDPRLPAELRRLRRLLPDDVQLIVGGAAAPAYRDVLEEIGALYRRDLAGLRGDLRALRDRAS